MKVFDVEEVRDPKRFLPTESEFADAVKGFRIAATQEIEEGRLVGAAIYGSVALALQAGPSEQYPYGETYGPWSDIDMSLTPTSATPDSFAAIKTVKARVNVSGHMDMGKPIQHTWDRLASANHELDRFFGTHLTSRARIVVGEDLAHYLRFPDTPADVIVAGYLRHKMQRMNDLIAPDTLRDLLHGLQRALELPAAVGRLALNSLDETEGTTTSPINSADKRSVIPVAMDLYESFGLAAVPEQLISLANTYKLSIMSALDGKLDEKQYVELLEEIRVTGIESGVWLDKFSLALLSRLQSRRLTS